MTINLCEHGAKPGGDIDLSPGQSIDLVLRAVTTEAVPAKVVWGGGRTDIPKRGSGS